MSDTYQADDQDQSEVFDETHTTEDAAQFTTFDEMTDVFDVTQALGDGRDIRASDADEFSEGDLDDEDLDDDEDIDTSVVDTLENVPETEIDTGDERDLGDGVAALAPDEAEILYSDDVDGVTDVADEEAGAYEADGVSDADLRELGYTDERGLATGLSAEAGGGGDDKEAPSEGTGAHADDVPETSHPRQEELLDEGVEETFPASDPVSVKHIT